ncbi:MAG: hypothetical protein K2X47_09560, partial [Bdellovibrionales bacterium]|nr:hypothetical protein [Bdellovibrionales bacterium]
VCGCSTPARVPESISQRQVAHVNQSHAHHAQILQSIPRIKGLESERDERKVSDRLVEIFRKIEDESRSDGRLHRGTHAKGKCFEGEFKVFSQAETTRLLNEKGVGDASQLSEKLAKGVFAYPGTYRAEMRFANAKGNVNNDTLGDVRGLSFSIDFGKDIAQDYAGDGRLDFMMNTSPMFAVNNIEEFLDLMKASRLQKGELGRSKLGLSNLGIKNLSAVKKAVALLKEYERADTLSYANEQYWANLPYTHGVSSDPNQQLVVKYKATPCSGDLSRANSSGKKSDFLQTDIIERVNQGTVCFQIQAQFFDLEKMKASRKDSMSKWSLVDWIENGGAFWDENILPFHTLAELKAKPIEKSCDQQFMNTRLHSNRANQPIGSIARVRTWVEEISRARRMGELP